jgi:hypothetical protein
MKPVHPKNLDKLNLHEEIEEDPDLEQLKYEVYGNLMFFIIHRYYKDDQGSGGARHPRGALDGQ